MAGKSLRNEDDRISPQKKTRPIKGVAVLVYLHQDYLAMTEKTLRVGRIVTVMH